MSDSMSKADINAFLRRIQSKIRVTKVTATRAVKGARGDNFAGFTALWNSVENTSDPVETDEALPLGVMTMTEARVAHLLIAMHADVAAHDAALAGGNISEEFHTHTVNAIKARFAHMLSKVVREDGSPAESTKT